MPVNDIVAAKSWPGPLDWGWGPWDIISSILRAGGPHGGGEDPAGGRGLCPHPQQVRPHGHRRGGNTGQESATHFTTNIHIQAVLWIRSDPELFVGSGSLIRNFGSGSLRSYGNILQ